MVKAGLRKLALQMDLSKLNLKAKKAMGVVWTYEGCLSQTAADQWGKRGDIVVSVYGAAASYTSHAGYLWNGKRRY